jgi:predicted RNA methylase
MIEAAIEPNDTVIDFGCGRGRAAELAAEQAERVFAVDHDPEAVRHTTVRCRDLPNVTVHLGDWSDALGDAQADVGLLLHMLEHLADPEQTLRTLRSSCQRLLIEVPDVSADPLNVLRHELGTPLYTDADHVTEFTPEHLHSTLKAAGWDIQRIDRAYGALIATAVHSGR